MVKTRTVWKDSGNDGTSAYRISAIKRRGALKVFMILGFSHFLISAALRGAALNGGRRSLEGGVKKRKHGIEMAFVTAIGD